MKRLKNLGLAALTAIGLNTGCAITPSAGFEYGQEVEMVRRGNYLIEQKADLEMVAVARMRAKRVCNLSSNGDTGFTFSYSISDLSDEKIARHYLAALPLADTNGNGVITYEEANNQHDRASMNLHRRLKISPK